MFCSHPRFVFLLLFWSECESYLTGNTSTLFFLTSDVSPSYPAGCATSFQVTVVTSTSWNVIATVASTNITESGAPTLSPSRCSHCVASSSETCSQISQPLSLYLFHILLLFLPSPSHSSTPWCLTLQMFTEMLFYQDGNKEKVE